MTNIFLGQEQTELDQLRSDIDACTACSIASSCTHKVPGEGPLGSDLMSISEAPGANEDKTGLPYQGRAGAYWESMLTVVGWDRSMFFTTNSMCCRPPGNKIEDISWVDNCRGFLHRHLNLFRPKLILLFGKTAGYQMGYIDAEMYRGTKPYGKLLGRQESFGFKDWEAQVFWLYHPSYLMKGNKDKECARMFMILDEARSTYHELVAETAR
jgi:uracil-DNA glycosylase